MLIRLRNDGLDHSEKENDDPNFWMPGAPLTASHVFSLRAREAKDSTHLQELTIVRGLLAILRIDCFTVYAQCSTSFNAATHICRA